MNTGKMLHRKFCAHTDCRKVEGTLPIVLRKKGIRGEGHHQPRAAKRKDPYRIS